LGRAYSIPAFKIPLSSRYSLGKAIVNYVELRPNERVVDVTNVKEFNEEQCLVFATQNGIIKRTELSQFDNIRRTGIIAINVREDDSLVCVKLCGPKSRILLATKKGYTIHFKVEEIRTTGRNTMGVKGIELRDEDDEVVDLIVAEENVEVLTFTKQGYGKRTKLEKYRLTHRAGKGVINIKLRNDKDEVIACKSIKEPMNVVMASKNGVIIRTRTKDVRSTGRATQGVIIMRLGNDDEVSGVAIAGQDKSENGDEETESSDDESKERDEDLEKDMQENSDTDTKDQIENATQEEKPAEDNELADVEKQIDDEEQSGDIEKQVDDEEQSEDENIPPEEE